MDKNKNILEEIGRKDGMTVPDGYFENFARLMSEKLPERDELSVKALEAPEEKTFWARIRPYTYMAAMFAGIWCMLKLFTILSASPYDISKIESNPIIAEAFNDDDFMMEYVYSDVNQWDVIDNFMSDDALEDISEEDLAILFNEPASDSE